MHRRLFGLSCTLAVLIAGYVIGWLADRVMHGFADLYTLSFFLLALILAAMFTASILFLVILPQTLLVRWFTRRFHLNRAAPFVLFFLLSSAVLLALAFLPNVKPLALYLVGTPYLVAACSVLWCISFHHEKAA
jgi:ABC-type dipeptide/oligopeptide/nickel transport system permease subunit